MSNFRMMLITRPTMLKIDRYLVSGVAGDTYQQATMRAIRLLADQVHADLVAEGVDNEEDLKSAAHARHRIRAGLPLLAPAHRRRPGGDGPPARRFDDSERSATLRSP